MFQNHSYSGSYVLSITAKDLPRLRSFLHVATELSSVNNALVEANLNRNHRPQCININTLCIGPVCK